MIEVTIGIPVYNVEGYVAKCLLSALDQDFRLSYEILVIDDCGTDRSIDEVQKVINSHKRGNLVKIIKHQENKGLGPARNTAMENAQGKYIFFLDSDDWISSDCIRLLYDKAIISDADVVVGSVSRVEELSRKEVGNNKYDDRTIKTKAAGVFMTGQYQDMHIEVWNKLYRISFLKENNIKFVHRIFEDYYFDFRMRASANVIALIPQTTLFYNIRDNSILTSLKKNNGGDLSAEIFCEIIGLMQKMIVAEYSMINGIYDLYFQRITWIAENLNRYHYTNEQWKYIQDHIGKFVSFVPDKTFLGIKRNQIMYRLCRKFDCMGQFIFANKLLSIKEKIFHKLIICKLDK